MTDFTPPSNSGQEPEPEHGPYGSPPPNAEWGQSPPAGTPPQPSPWGDPTAPAPWSDPAHQAPQQYGSEPYPYGAHGSGWPGPYAVPHYPKSSQATTALVLSIFGLLCCGPLSLVGMLMGRSEVKAIGRGEIDPTNHGTAQAGFIVGLVGTIIWAGLLVLYVAAIALSIAASP